MVNFSVQCPGCLIKMIQHDGQGGMFTKKLEPGRFIWRRQPMAGRLIGTHPLDG
ncbi:hypothetical protein RHEC894_PC00442 (plasmid) [Rhizobium sp. CIAT894]|nr:hypothetical protein RHEC894_PC00442 [Rhizobium sp. CIAT894]ARO27047.1 hypothetical protein TAL182_PC00449 [Rhizobium sp. TAL182]ARQ60917.1 hypothetical protein Kim5_PA00457 [Rhizobium sp. Kim5]KKZ84465.1 hypothetical protein RPHASCH2410_PC00630 [Rhizobium phaseoli Ch24-10]